MSKVSKSVLKGAKQALNYAKGQKKGAKAHKIKVMAEKKRNIGNESVKGLQEISKWQKGKVKLKTASVKESKLTLDKKL